MKAIPKITVRIDRGEDWVEISEDWQDRKLTVCQNGCIEDWISYEALELAWIKLNEAVME